MPPVSCQPPTCYLTRPRKRSGQRTLPGKCMRPNPWIMFMIKMGGQGLDRKMISFMYKRWKRQFHAENPNLSKSEMKVKMNEELCREIAETNRLARSRKSSRHLKETRVRRREIAKKNAETRRKKAVAEAKALENARARERKAAAAAAAKAVAEAKAAAVRAKKAEEEAKAKARDKAKAAEASKRAKASAAKAKEKAKVTLAKAKAKAKANESKGKGKSKKPKAKQSAALGWDCVRPHTITSSRKEKMNSCEQRPGGQYRTRGQCYEKCYKTTHSAEAVRALQASVTAAEAAAKADAAAKEAKAKAEDEATARARAMWEEAKARARAKEAEKAEAERAKAEKAETRAQKALKEAGDKGKKSNNNKENKGKGKTSQADRSAKLFFAEKPVPRGWNLYKTVKSLPHFSISLGPGRSSAGVRLHKTSLETLMPGKWLTDDVIFAYMMLLQQNCPSQKNLFMDPFFYTLFTVSGQLMSGKKKGKKEKHDPQYKGKSPSVRYALVRQQTSSLDTTGPVKIFVPVNHDNEHWTLIVIDVEEKQVVSMDSFGGDNEDAMSEMLDWVEQEHIHKKKSFDKQEWTKLEMDVPIQKNAIDCGVFTCMFAAYYSHDRPMEFTQRNMSKMRARLAWSILNKQL